MCALKTIRVDAAAGWWVVNAYTGLVIESAQWELRDDDLPPVVRFDLKEWLAWRRHAGFDHGYKNVYWLALGSWMPDGSFRPPEDDFRADLLVTYAVA
ncbi:hypothetical protein [Luteibacter sp. 22Crub2.1]|uniref:hypothetical protein n=1 Tax=Luteibacter sp. 22Crub2.1 TaxID=1283288 RepID=UPI0009A67CEC|nr:hypothetical protein [Luteibacter sp. 22Crub2.1]SKB51069.1 hypothetical protein SAMN05660880_01390 [Luteibacter sp. 22Crub2.1]